MKIEPITDVEVRAVATMLSRMTPGPYSVTGAPWFRIGSGVMAGDGDPHRGYMIADCEAWDGQREEDRENREWIGDPEDDAAGIACILEAWPAIKARLDTDVLRSNRDRQLIKDLALSLRDCLDALEAVEQFKNHKTTHLPDSQATMAIAEARIAAAIRAPSPCGGGE